MGDHKYLINSRFLVDVQVHCIKDMSTGVDHHLEPRLMEVLVALLKNPGTLVTRETLIREIWNDYGGAEEGLTQAISTLRKLLADEAKDIIKTVPKKGYMLMAPVAKQNHAAPMTGSKSRSKLVYVAGIGLVAVVSLFLLTFNRRTETVPPVQEESKTIEVAFPGLEEADDTTYLNTISTTDSSGNRYRLVMIGDRRPKFFINDTLQQNTESYTALVDKLAKELWKRQKEAEEERK
jgi:DNA-binding winged helix-turn-helix (wHTH) protein